MTAGCVTAGRGSSGRESFGRESSDCAPFRCVLSVQAVFLSYRLYRLKLICESCLSMLRISAELYLQVST